MHGKDTLEPLRIKVRALGCAEVALHANPLS